MTGEPTAKRDTDRARADPSASGEQSSTRRQLVRGAAGVAATLAAPGLAAAQEREPEGVNTPVAVENAAPKFGHADYRGLFVQITGYDREINASGVGSCGFIGDDTEVVGFDAHIIDKIEGDHQSAETTVFAADSNDDIEPGKLFVVNRQEPCTGGYTTLMLENIGASSISTPAPKGGTESPIPGFGIAAALAGLAAAALGLARRGAD